MSGEPVVIGAGPAGCAAAIRLARAGHRPLLIDRDETARDSICGGFLSWQTAEALREIGLDPAAHGAHRVDTLAIFAGGSEARAVLPAPAFGLSRRTMDNALRSLASNAGAGLVVDRVRSIDGAQAIGENATYRGDALFLASGKTDVRGLARPREATDPALGIRLHAIPDQGLATILSGRIELHLFDGGYAGIVLQEDGRANICLAVRKSLLASSGGHPRMLVDRLAYGHPSFGKRMAFVARDAIVDTIASVPYGWRAKAGVSGIFRMGDQAAAIPSLAGEGMGIALASAADAVAAYLSDGAAAAPAYQRAFARRARRPLAAAGLVWGVGETPAGARLLRSVTHTMPSLAHFAMRASRI